MKSFKDKLEEGGLWDNIHAKRKRIKAGSKERMRKPGSKGAPSAQDFRDSQNEEKEKGVDGKACWKGYKRMGTKKKGGKTVDNCVPMEDVASVQPMSGPTGSMFAMNKEGKEHSWKSEGHYTKDGKEWTGPQHAHNGQVMTGEKHTADSQNLYHYKELSKEAQDKVEKSHEKIDEGIVDTVLKSKTLNKKNYSLAAAELKKRIAANKNKPKETHSYDVARMHRNVDHRKLSTMVSGDWIQGDPILEKLNASKNSVGDYVKDFKKSDAPQFKGRSSSKRRQMAIAAYLGSKRKNGERAMRESIKYNSDMGAMDWGTPAGTDYMKDVTPGQKNPKESPIKTLEQSTLKKLNVDDSYVKEQAVAGETKKKYREDNADIAPEPGIVPLSKDEINALYSEIESMSYEEMEEYGFFGEDDDDEYDYESNVDWEDFDMEEVEITEVLSVQGRLKRKFSARKNKQKLRVARNIAMRRGSSPDRLKKRATRGARGMVYKRLLKGRDRSSLPPAEKGRLEKLIGMYAPLVSRLAVRMLPGMRKMEINRMKNRKGGAQKAKKYKAAKPAVKKQTAKKFKIKR